MSSADVIDRLKRHDIGSIDRAVALIERLAAQVAERDQTIEDLERAEMLARESSEWALRNQKQAEASAADYLARAERAEAEAARNAKDAERGRYLIEKAMLHSNGTDGESRWAIYVGKRDEPYPKSSPYYKGPPFATLTAAIDAALESRKPSTKGEPK
jgi:hypothetical protein